MKQISMRDAINEAIIEEVARDPNVFYLGEDLSTAGRLPLYEAIPNNIMDMPIAEMLITNASIGMAMGGMRPIFDTTFQDFISLSFDGLVNQAAKLRFWSQGTVSCPLVCMLHGGIGAGLGNNHSQKVEAWIDNVPGLKILIPSTAADAKGMMKSAIRDDDPVVLLLDQMTSWFPEQVPEGEYLTPMGKAKIAREGTDVSVVCWQRTYKFATELADELAQEGISLEIVDPLSLCPFDKETIIQSVRKTGRLVVSHEACYKFGPGAEIVASVVEEALGSLKSPPVRACSPMTAIPTFKAEQEVMVNKDQLKAAIYKTLGK